MSDQCQQNWQNNKQHYVSKTGLVTPFINTEGQAPTLVMIHGMTDSSRSFSLLLPHLAGHHILIPDLPGHAGAAYDKDIFNLSRVAEGLQAFIIGQAKPSVVLIGHSMGAMLALMVAKNMAANVKALVLLSSSLRPNSESNSALWYKLSNINKPFALDDPFWDAWHSTTSDVATDFKTYSRHEASAIDMAVWQKMTTEVFNADLTPMARSIQCPTLIIFGDDDEVFGDDHQSQLIDTLIPSKVERIQKCGHNPQWEYPQRVAGMISNFLSFLPDFDPEKP